MKYFENVEDEVFVFNRGDNTSVTIEKGNHEKDGIFWRIGFSEPENVPYVYEVEVEGARHNSVSEMQYVWVLWCFDDEDREYGRFHSRRGKPRWCQARSC